MVTLALAILFVALGSPTARAGERELRLATTASVQDSGLLDALLPELAKDTGVKVRVTAASSLEALRLLAAGEADVVLSPAPLAEAQRLAVKAFIGRYPLMESFFLVAGPSADPAKVREATSGADALRRIASAGAPYVSRGDNSDTHAREQELFAAAGLDPKGGWPGFVRSGAGMAETLRVAGERKAYALTDLATFLGSRKRTGLERLTRAGDDLRSVYAVVQIFPEKDPGKIRADGAASFVEWFLRRSTGRKIAEFKQAEYGEPVFRPVTFDDE